MRDECERRKAQLPIHPYPFLPQCLQDEAGVIWTGKTRDVVAGASLTISEKALAFHAL